MLDPRWRRLARLRWYCNGSCIAAIVVGGLALWGRVFHIEPLKSGSLHSVSIQPNICIGLILLGGSLWMLLPDPPRRSNRYWALFFSALVALTGALTLVEYVFGLNLHIDQILLTTGASGFTKYSPGRMSPITAITFVALGLALLLLDWETRRGWRPAQLLSLCGALAGIMSLSGYINGAEPVYKVFSFTPIAVFTALTMLMISVSVFFARPKVGIAGDVTGRFLGSAMARRFLPAVIVVPLFAAWFRMQVEHAGWFGTNLGLALNVTMNVVTLSLLVWLNARQLNKTEESLEAERDAKDVLYDASLRDELTGLYNRRGFLSFAEEQIKLACSGRRELLVVFADVDGLKGINDGFGHAEGDRALRKVAEVLLTVFRDTDLVARLGGDEFAILALDCSPAGLVRINAHFDKVLRTINAGDNPWKLSISLGTLHVDASHQLSIGDLLRKADGIMYERKRGRLVLA